MDQPRGRRGGRRGGGRGRGRGRRAQAAGGGAAPGPDDEAGHGDSSTSPQPGARVRARVIPRPPSINALPAHVNKAIDEDDPTALNVEQWRSIALRIPSKMTREAPRPEGVGGLIGSREWVAWLQVRETHVALVAAAERGQEKVIRAILGIAGVDINQLGAIGHSALARAAAHGHEKIVALLLDAGASINARGIAPVPGTTALHMACRYAQIGAMHILIDLGADQNAVDDGGRSPIFYASEVGFLEGVDILIEKPGILLGEDHSGESPIDAAIYHLNALRRQHSKANDRARGNRGRGGRNRNRRRNSNDREARSHSQGVAESVAEKLILRMARKYDALYTLFRSITYGSLRQSIIEEYGVQNVMERLTHRPTAEDDTVTFNSILSSLCSFLKKHKTMDGISHAVFDSVMKVCVTEGSVAGMQSLASLLSQPFARNWITTDVVGTLVSAIHHAMTVSIFNIQPLTGYTMDFVYTIMPAFLRIWLGLEFVDEEALRQEFDKSFENLWAFVRSCLSGVDANVTEAEHVAIVIGALYQWDQVMGVPDVIMDTDNNKSKRPNLAWYFDKRELSPRIKNLGIEFAEQLWCIADDLEELYVKYFEHSHRMLGLAGKSRLVESMALQHQELLLIEINRLHSSAEARSDAFDFFVQQVASADPKGFNGAIECRFVDEPGVGDGPAREMVQYFCDNVFFQDSTREVLLSTYFVAGPAQTVLHLAPRPSSQHDSSNEQSALQIFMVTGRMLALAVVTGNPIGVRLSKALLKAMLEDEDSSKGAKGRAPRSKKSDQAKDDHSISPVSKCSSVDSSILETLRDFDAELFTSLKRLADHPLDPSLDLYFTYTLEEGGQSVDVELVPGGRELRIDDTNKGEFIGLLAQRRLWGQGRGERRDSLVEGFQAVMSRRQRSYLSLEELAELVEGRVDIDVDFIRSITEYAYGFDDADPVVNWFWEMFREQTPSLQRRILLFWSGSPVPPLGDTLKYGIAPLLGSTESLPKASTCAYMLQLPRYESREQLVEKFRVMLQSGFLGYDVV